MQTENSYGGEAEDLIPAQEGGRWPAGPPPAYGELRETQPVCPVTMATGQPAWLITRYADVKQMLGDPRSSSDRSKPGCPAYPLPAEELGKRWLSRLDPPEHDVIRRMVAPEFSVRRISRMRPRLEVLRRARPVHRRLRGKPRRQEANGYLDPDRIVTPGIFIDRVAQATQRVKDIEKVTVRARDGGAAN